MSNRLAVIIPTRSRPEAIAQVIESFEATETTADLFIVCDDDDPRLDDYKALAVNICIFAREGKGMAKPLNKASKELAYNYDFFAFLGDDHRPRTQKWDDAFEAELDKLGTGLVYGNDLIQGEGLPTAVAMTSDIVRLLGGMTPPNMIHLYLDNFWLKLGQDLNRIHYLPEVIIEHLHPIAGKAEWDANYREVNAQEVYSADAVAFKDYIASADYQRLLETLRDQA